MAEIPATEKKLREARFFLVCMERIKDRSPDPNPEEGDFYLSAFLSASRSVTWVLQAEQKELYNAWFDGWRAALPEDERDLLKFGNEQRVEAVHVKGAKVDRTVEYVPVTEIPVQNRSHPAYGFHWFGPPGIEPPKVGLRRSLFNIGGASEEVCRACRRYLELLQRLVHDFHAAHS